jgi:early secretory antigenic target protein ESAT-6
MSDALSYNFGGIEGAASFNRDVLDFKAAEAAAYSISSELKHVIGQVDNSGSLIEGAAESGALVLSLPGLALACAVDAATRGVLPMQDTEKGVTGMFAAPQDAGVLPMQQTEQAVGGMFASAGDAGGETAQKLASIWGGAGSDAYQQTQQRWDSTAAELNAALKDLSDKVGQAGASAAADDAASSLGQSMGFTPPDVFDLKTMEPGEVASLKYNFGGIEGAASAYQPDTDGGWLLGDGGNGGIPATMAEWALLLA